jgi:hypothetical protein
MGKETGAGGNPTKSRLRKSPTWSVLDGPPMFMNTMAVGPLEDGASCATGGAIDASDRRWLRLGWLWEVA